MGQDTVYPGVLFTKRLLLLLHHSVKSAGPILRRICGTQVRMNLRLWYNEEKIMGGYAMFRILVVEDDRELNRSVCALISAFNSFLIVMNFLGE